MSQVTSHADELVRADDVVVNIDEPPIFVGSSDSPVAEPSLPWDFRSRSQTYAEKKSLTNAEAAAAAAGVEGEVAEAVALAEVETDRLSAIRSSLGPNEGLVGAIVEHFTSLMKNKSSHTAQTPSEMKSGNFDNSVMSQWDSPRNSSHLYASSRNSNLSDVSDGFSAEAAVYEAARNTNFSDVSFGTFAKTASMLQAAQDQAAAVESKRLSSQEVTDDGPLVAGSSRSSMDTRARRQRILSSLILWALPTACTVWYAAAIFFPADAQAAVPALLWTPGDSVWVNGTVSCCPKPALCSEGWAQFWLLVAARLSAFAMYPSMLLVFLSKCHAALRFLSRTFVAELLPLSHLHDMHSFHGILFASLALLHTAVHLVWPEDCGSGGHRRLRLAFAV